MKRKICLIILVFLVATVLGFFIYKNQNKKVELPKINFDTEIRLPNTKIIFKYPSQGFYNLGIKINNLGPENALISGIHAEPIAEFDKNFQSAYVTEEIRLFKNEKNFKNTDELALFYKTNENITAFDGEYASANGRVLEIKENKYFVYKVTEDVTAWRALAITEEGIVEVSLVYKKGNTLYSEVAYKNNEALFWEILENVYK